jgi:peptidoglycan hydrolase CwlO-like protein
MADIETRVAIVEKELGTVYGIFSRFETTIEKITDVSSSLKELIAVHDNRLMEREKADLTLFDIIEKRKEEYARGAERIYHKMDEISTDLRKEIKHEINEQYDELKEAVLGFNQGMRDIADKIDKRIDQQIEQRDKKLNTIDQTIEKLDTRIKTLENWRWMIMGACLIVGFLVGKWGQLGSMFAGA